MIRQNWKWLRYFQFGRSLLHKTAPFHIGTFLCSLHTHKLCVESIKYHFQKNIRISMSTTPFPTFCSPSKPKPREKALKLSVDTAIDLGAEMNDYLNHPDNEKGNEYDSKCLLFDIFMKPVDQRRYKTWRTLTSQIFTEFGLALLA